MLNYHKHKLRRVFVDFFFENEEKVASWLKIIPISRLECKNHTLFMTKLAEKTIPFRAAHTYIAYKGVPPGGGGRGNQLTVPSQ